MEEGKKFPDYAERRRRDVGNSQKYGRKELKNDPLCLEIKVK
jgi:hypothetical protein